MNNNTKAFIRQEKNMILGMKKVIKEAKKNSLSVIKEAEMRIKNAQKNIKLASK